MMKYSIDAETLYRELAGQGFSRLRVHAVQELQSQIRKSRPFGRRDSILSVDPRSSLVITAFPFARDLPPAGKDDALVAPFAAARYYKEACSRLKKALHIVLQRPPGDARVRFFSNSGFAEKLIAAVSGLGSFGLNSLILTPDCGSSIVLAGAILPEGSIAPSKGAVRCIDEIREPRCKECGKCVRACPVNALSNDGKLHTDRCIQAWSSQYSRLPDIVRRNWGRRLYGCTICQDVCPLNKNSCQGNRIDRGYLGPGLAIAEILAHTPSGLTQRLKGTALSPGWIDKRALIRNAILAAAHVVHPDILHAVKQYTASPDPVLREAALYTQKQTQTSP